MITSVEFWAEIKSLAKSVLADYDHAAIKAIEAIKEELAGLQKDLAAATKTNEDTNELQQTIADKQTEIVDAIDALTVDDLDDVYDKVHEMVDGHEWVIYYGKAWDVAHLMSGDENACSEFEELASFENGKSLDDLICQFAYCALNSNVIAEMESALDEYKLELRKECSQYED